MIETAVGFLEAHFKLFAALDLNLNGRTKLVNARGYERRRCYTRPARLRFGLNSPLERADANSSRAQHLNEVHIGSLWTKVRMTSDLRPERFNHGSVSVGHKQNGMGHSCVQ